MPSKREVISPDAMNRLKGRIRAVFEMAGVELWQLGAVAGADSYEKIDYYVLQRMIDSERQSYKGADIIRLHDILSALGVPMDMYLALMLECRLVHCQRAVDVPKIYAYSSLSAIPRGYTRESYEEWLFGQLVRQLPGKYARALSVQRSFMLHEGVVQPYVDNIPRKQAESAKSVQHMVACSRYTKAANAQKKYAELLERKDPLLRAQLITFSILAAYSKLQGVVLETDVDDMGISRGVTNCRTRGDLEALFSVPGYKQWLEDCYEKGKGNESQSVHGNYFELYSEAQLRKAHRQVYGPQAGRYDVAVDKPLPPYRYIQRLFEYYNVEQDFCVNLLKKWGKEKVDMLEELFLDANPSIAEKQVKFLKDPETWPMIRKAVKLDIVRDKNIITVEKQLLKQAAKDMEACRQRWLQTPQYREERRYGLSRPAYQLVERIH